MAKHIDNIYNNISISFYLYQTESLDLALNIIRSRSKYEVYSLNNVSLGSFQYDLAVVDLLNINTTVLNCIKDNSNFLVSIDNTSKARCLSDIAINPLYYNVDNLCENILYDFIGPEFQIISPTYLNMKSIWNDSVKNVLIIQGGADPFSITSKILKGMEQFISDNSNISFNIVVGPANLESSFLLDLKAKYGSRILIHKNIYNMANLLKNIDVAVSSIGVTAFELASMGIPSIYVTGIHKELETGRRMSELDCGFYIGMYDDLKLDKLHNYLINLTVDRNKRKSIRKKCLKVFDSKKSKELIKFIIKSYQVQKKEAL